MRAKPKPILLCIILTLNLYIKLEVGSEAHKKISQRQQTHKTNCAASVHNFKLAEQKKLFIPISVSFTPT